MTYEEENLESIFETHPSKARHFEYLYGIDVDGERGLIEWIKNELREELPEDWGGIIYTGLTTRDTINRKGLFPAIQVLAISGDFEGINHCENEEVTTVYIITTTRDSDPAEAYINAQRYANDIYDLLRVRTPAIDGFEDVPIAGNFDYDFEKGGNRFLGFSLLSLDYRWRISTEES